MTKLKHPYTGYEIEVEDDRVNDFVATGWLKPVAPTKADAKNNSAHAENKNEEK